MNEESAKEEFASGFGPYATERAKSGIGMGAMRAGAMAKRSGAMLYRGGVPPTEQRSMPAPMAWAGHPIYPTP